VVPSVSGTDAPAAIVADHHRMKSARRPSRRTLLGVWAHPDDEAYLSAGLMARIVDAGGRVVCVHATDGERGTDDPDRWPPARLGRVRRYELRASLAALGVTESRRLGLPDGGLAACDGEQAARSLAELIRSVAPDIIATFGPDGMTGHPDHKAVSRWATSAWLATGRGADLLYATTSAAFVERHASLYAAYDLVLEPGLPRPTPQDELALDLALTGWELDRKRVALAAHASQTVPVASLLGEDRFRALSDREMFRRPTALEASGDPTSSSSARALFETHKGATR
jgi:LmbE family N-acetylglucosaminyl deacetylase